MVKLGPSVLACCVRLDGPRSGLKRFASRLAAEEPDVLADLLRVEFAEDGCIEMKTIAPNAIKTNNATRWPRVVFPVLRRIVDADV